MAIHHRGELTGRGPVTDTSRSGRHCGDAERETESVCVLLQHVSVNVFSRWTHTGRRWLTSALSLQPCTHKRAGRGTRNKDVDRTSEGLKPHNQDDVKKKCYYSNVLLFKYKEKNDVSKLTFILDS